MLMIAKLRSCKTATVLFRARKNGVESAVGRWSSELTAFSLGVSESYDGANTLRGAAWCWRRQSTTETRYIRLQ